MFTVALVLILIWRFKCGGKKENINIYEASFGIAVFYYGAYILNTQSFEFRYYFPSWLLLFLIIFSLSADLCFRNKILKKIMICLLPILAIVSFCGTYGEYTKVGDNIVKNITKEGTLLCENGKNYVWKNAIVIGAITAASFGLFTVHYLSVVAASDFFLALKNRFFARNIASSTLLTDVFGSYLKSFLLLWILLFFLIIWNIIKNEKIELKNKCILFVLAFPLLENVVMKEHALSYSYDRMKMVFILSYLICELVAQILVSYEKRNKAAFIIIAIVTVICCFGNLNYYRKDSKYIWDITYRETNKKISEYINQNYWNSVLTTNASVRGYLNLLFNRGIYEWGDIDSVRDIALQKGKRYAIELKTLDAPGNMYQLTGAIVYDVAVDKFIYIKLRNDGTIVELNNDVEEYNLADLTDENWTSGYSNVGNVLLFYYEEELLNNLRNGTFVSTGERQFTIQDIKYDSQWIEVTVEGDASSCKYPAYISIQ